MKLLIEIPDYVYEHAKESSEDSNDEFIAIRAIENGTPIPDVNNLIQRLEKERFNLK